MQELFGTLWMDAKMLSTTDPGCVGSLAPDFNLADGFGTAVSMREMRGQPVILAFLPTAWDPTRAAQLAHFNSLVRQIPGVDAELLGISRDGTSCDLSFADEEMRVTILEDLDPGGSVAEAFGVGGESAVVVVDAEGRVHWRHDGPAPLVEEMAAALAELVPASVPPELLADHEDAAGFGFDIAPTRRQFLITTLAAAFALAAQAAVAKAEPVATALTRPEMTPGLTQRVALKINGRSIALDLEPRVTLLDALREYAGLTATKKGCDHGQCGACTVHINGRRQLSCL
ncbi:MAG: redoxin domain-containing protein, partial [Gemmatimonadaceae bacterium]